MKVEVYLQVVFVLCCCTFVEIFSQTPSGSSCTVSINRTGNNSLEVCTCGSRQRCRLTCTEQIPPRRCIQLEQVDPVGGDVECNWVPVGPGANQQSSYCLSNCPALNDMSRCISAEISPCLGMRNMTVTINCLMSTPTTIPPSVVSPTTTHIEFRGSGSVPQISNSLSKGTFQSVLPTIAEFTMPGDSTTNIPLVTSMGTFIASTSIVRQQEQSSLLATSMSTPSESAVPSVTRENITPTATSTLQSRHITSTVQGQGQTTLFSFNEVKTTTITTSTVASSEAVLSTATFSVRPSNSVVSGQSTNTADNMFITPTTTTTTDATTATRAIPSESPILVTTSIIKSDQNTISVASISVTENPTVSIVTTATPALPPTMSTQETNPVSTVGVIASPTTNAVTTDSSSATTQATKNIKEQSGLSPLALALISVFGGLSVVITLATCVTLFLICHSIRKKKSYIVRNGPSHTEPVYSEVFEAEGGQPHLYESMTRYMLPSYSQYKRKRFPKKAGTPSSNNNSNTVQITISETHDVITPGVLPPPTSNGTAVEAHLSGLSQGSNLQVDPSYIPNPYETPVSSLGDLRNQEGYAQVRDTSSTASPVIGQISDHGYTDVRPITDATRSYSLGDVRNGYMNVRHALAPRIYEAIHSPTKVVARSKGYVNARKYHVISRSYSLDDIRNRPYVNVRPPSPLGDLKLGGYTDVSSRKPRPRSYESPIEDSNDGGYLTVSPPRPRSYESPVHSVVSEGKRSATDDDDNESCCCDELDEIHTDGGGYSKLDTSLLDGYAILEPYIPGRNNIYSHLRYNI